MREIFISLILNEATTKLHHRLAPRFQRAESRGADESWNEKPRTAKIPGSWLTRGLCRSDDRPKQIAAPGPVYRRAQASVNPDKWMYLCTV